IGGAFDQRSENDLIPIVPENIGQELFEERFVQWKRPRLKRAFASVESGHDWLSLNLDAARGCHCPLPDPGAPLLTLHVSHSGNCAQAVLSSQRLRGPERSINRSNRVLERLWRVQEVPAVSRRVDVVDAAGRPWRERHGESISPSVASAGP